MPGQTIKIPSREGGAFDCYLATPATDDKVPAVVLASAVHGVDKDIRELADEFAAHGSPTSAACRNSTGAPRRWASATAAPTRSSGPSGWATTPASPATARACSISSRS